MEYTEPNFSKCIEQVPEKLTVSKSPCFLQNNYDVVVIIMIMMMMTTTLKKKKNK